VEEILGEHKVGATLEECVAETMDLSLGDGPGGVDATLATMCNSIELGFGFNRLHTWVGGI
jgi:hypothetical protein